MSCNTVRGQTDTSKRGFRIKNTFLDIEEEKDDVEDRQRAHTTPEDHLPSLASLLDEFPSDSKDLLQARELVLRVKNTFLEVEEEKVDADDRQRAHTTPGNVLSSLVEELSSDSDDELHTREMCPCATTDPYVSIGADREETCIDSNLGEMIDHSALNPSEAGYPKFTTGDHSRSGSSDSTRSTRFESDCDLLRPALRVKNTFLDIQEESIVAGSQRVRTAPERTLTSLRDELSSDSEAEEESITNIRGLVQPLGCDFPIVNNGAPQTLQGMALPLVPNSGCDGCERTECGASIGLASLESDVESVKGNVWTLSRSGNGSWRVQQALDAAGTEEARLVIGRELEGRVWEAAVDLHANFVLQKMIVLMHSRSIQFMIEELSRFPGAACIVAKNRYGCRVIQRLLEYCSAAQMSRVIEDLLQDVASNCHNRYSAYVMQCLLDHCTGCLYRRLIQILMYQVQDICTDDHGCSVINKALTTGVREDQEALARLILSTPGVFEQMKASQGEFVARRVFHVFRLSNEFNVADIASDRIQDIICSALPPSVSVPKSTKPEARSRRRGAGGGAQAQATAEARDLVVSLHVACGRRAPVRIQKAMEKVARTILASSILPPTLIVEASQAYGQAAQVLKSIVPGERKCVV